MIFSLKEITLWLGITLFEIWVGLISLLVFVILLGLRSEGFLSNTSWYLIFAPLFVADGLNAYFCIIVLIRMYLEGLYKTALFRASWSFALLALVFVFQFLLCRKIQSASNFEYTEIMTPLFIILQLIAVRACQIN
ncbi:transmembrane protein 203 [Neocloeon triangulifer]|uniref:transmembrane protein 203 n=1 Tax=Neocloeon triangulifer TaxID=2078957 RepID=UPI00286F2AC3|nr:transmembrane protein 203 [Neocloeon triangulifer]